MHFYQRAIPSDERGLSRSVVILILSKSEEHLPLHWLRDHHMIIQMTYTLYVIHTMIDRKATRQTLQHLHEILPTLQMRSSLHLRLAVGIALPMIIKSEAIKDIPRGIPPLDESAVVDDLISNILWDPLGLTGADTKVPGVVDRGVGAGYICGKYGAVAHEPGEGAGIHDAVSYLAVFGLRGTEHCIALDSLSAK